jgi:hypothetical protein
MSDCYFGLDIDRDIKYEVTAMKSHRVEHEPEHNDTEDKSYFRKMMDSMMPQEEEEVSDK